MVLKINLPKNESLATHHTYFEFLITDASFKIISFVRCFYKKKKIFTIRYFNVA